MESQKANSNIPIYVNHKTAEEDTELKKGSMYTTKRCVKVTESKTGDTFLTIFIK